MVHIRSMAAAALATGLVIFASSSVMANSEINDTREARRAYCQNAGSNKGLCMKQTAQSLQHFNAWYRKCLNDPQMLKSYCDSEYSKMLGSLNTGTD